ncbi:hypothetical protein NS220_18290 [Microbacterium testaceum]|uniref:Uncharacterized protein n=1 Tax=Microbacterium testaceum TaxID=2033 RepID=A0A147EQ97_MICTE|nr:hypothetical protein NS220_18290 [Microbacterium testaceum]
MHVDAGEVNGIRIDLPRLDEVLDLHDAGATGHRGEGVEAARGLAEHEVAVAVALPGVDEREVGGDGLFEHELARLAVHVEDTHVLRGGSDRDAAGAVIALRQPALGDLRADARLRVEGGDPRSSGTELLGEGPLRGQLELEFTGEELPLELLVLAHVRRGHLADATGTQQDAEPPVVDAAVVRHHREVARALGEERLDEGDGIAGETEAADGERRAVGDVRDRLGGRGPGFVDHAKLLRVCVLSCSSSRGTRHEPLLAMWMPRRVASTSWTPPPPRDRPCRARRPSRAPPPCSGS